MPWAPSSRTCSPRRERVLDEPRRVVEVRRAAARPRPAPGRRAASTSNALGAHRGEEQVLVGQDAPDPLARSASRRAGPPSAGRARHARSPYVGPIPRPVVPTFAPPSRASFATVERHVVRHDHVRAAADPDPARRRCRARSSMSSSSISVTGLTTTPVADDRGDVRVEHARRDELELEDLVADDDRVAGVVAALVADDHRDLLGEEVGGLALALVAPLEPDDHGGRHQRGPGHERDPGPAPGFRIHLSRVPRRRRSARRFVEGAQSASRDERRASLEQRPISCQGGANPRSVRGPAEYTSADPPDGRPSGARWDVRWRARQDLRHGRSGRARPVSTDGVMRLLGGLALLASFGLIAAWIAVPTAFDSWVSEGAPLAHRRRDGRPRRRRDDGAARVRLLTVPAAAPRQGRRADRRGRLGVTVGAKPSGGGLEGRLARALDGIVGGARRDDRRARRSTG